ncbi:MAG: 4'-phosphopantetheinyl transferase superfamily protein [Bacteroidales bacterium]|jgi:4'-phosphopantetheinyl transferase|nr:4'-phosphopantetheinyl transferase superfamily protein [Bacteroidales bacterium]
MVFTFFELDKITDDVFESWLEKTPKFRQDAVLRYRFREDRKRSLCAYLLLCVGLGRMVENFIYNEHGKPSLTDDNFHINLSHGKAAVAAGFSETPIGVDVEFIRENYPKIVCKRVFTPSEIEQIENASEPTLMFFKFWTLKESYIKCLGDGFTFPLQTVEFTLNGKDIRCSDERFLFSTFSQNGHQISVCGTEQQNVKDLNFDEFSAKIKLL